MTFFLIISIVLSGLLSAQSIDFPSLVKQSEHFELAWQTKNILETPESVFWDADSKLLYVSNINGSPRDKDGNGYISMLTANGEIIQQKWVTGMNAPKGMGKSGSYLFVTDIDVLVKIQIETGEIVKRYPGLDAKFLNDVAVGDNGDVFVSDYVLNRVYRLSEDSLMVWIDSSDKLTGINGLRFKDSSLLAGIRNSIVKINPKTAEIKNVLPHVSSIDGLLPVNKGGFITSDWVGHIFYLDAETPATIWLDLTKVKMNAADMEYIAEQKLLLVPTFSDNRLLALKVKF